MKVDKKILTIFGDSKFPAKNGSTFTANKYKRSVSNIMEFLKTANPDKIYILPDNEVSLVAALCATELDYNVTLVGPFPGFFSGLTKSSKKLLREVSEKSKGFLLLAEECGTGEEAIEIFKEAIDFCINASNGIAFLRSKDSTNDFQAFMDSCSSNTENSCFELVYDTR
jgi:hypothetical protein